MSKPEKKCGFSQGIFQVSSTAKEIVGTPRKTMDGKTYAYAKAGAAALAPGKMSQAAAVASVVSENLMTVAAAIGTVVLADLTIGSSTYAADYFKGGTFQVNKGTGAGQSYPIVSSSAVTAGTSINITIEEGLKVALDTTSEFTLVHNRFMATVEAAVEENIATGVTPVVVPIGYYYWSQIGGEACALITATPAVGTGLILSASVAGSLDDQLTALDVDEPVWAVAMGTVGVAGEYKPVLLCNMI